MKSLFIPRADCCHSSCSQFPLPRTATNRLAWGDEVSPRNCKLWLSKFQSKHSGHSRTERSDRENSAYEGPLYCEHAIRQDQVAVRDMTFGGSQVWIWDQIFGAEVGT